MLLLLQKNEKPTPNFDKMLLLKLTESSPKFLLCFGQTDIFTAEKLDREHMKHAEFKVVGVVQDFNSCQIKYEAEINLLWMVFIPPCPLISHLKMGVLGLLPFP